MSGLLVGETQNKSDVFSNCKMREQSPVLQNITYSAAESDRIPISRPFALDKNLACGRLEQTVDEF